MDIKPELYDLWLEWLIKTVEEFDSQFTKDIESAWRNVMRPGIEFMKSRASPRGMRTVLQMTQLPSYRARHDGSNG